MTERERGPGFAPESSSRPEEIEREIGETRSAIGEDLRELSERLSPEHLKESAKTAAKEAVGAAVGQAKEAVGTAVEQVREVSDRAYQRVSERVGEFGEQAKRAGSTTASIVGRNAVPLTLIGVGVSWMTLAARRSRAGEGWHEEFGPYRRQIGSGSFESIETRTLGTEPTRMRGSRQLLEEGGERIEQMERSVAGKAGEVREKAREKVGEVREKAREKVDEVREKARGKAMAVQERARGLTSEARSRIHTGTERTRDFAQENPLALAAAALAAGVGIGLLLPLSRQEDQLLGSARERIQSKAREALQEGREVAHQIASTARDTAYEARNALRPSE